MQNNTLKARDMRNYHIESIYLRQLLFIWEDRKINIKKKINQKAD